MAAAAAEHAIGFLRLGHQTVLDAAYRVHPERFVCLVPKPTAVPAEVWINKPLDTDEKTH